MIDLSVFEIVSYLLAGAFGGLIIGLFGTGSSLVILPTLAILFASLMPTALSLKMAIGTCLSTILVGSIFGAISYIRERAYDKKMVLLGIPAVFIGGVLSPMVSIFVSTEGLKNYVSIFLILIALVKLFPIKSSLSVGSDSARFVVMILCAFMSGLAGVALGILIIPFLTTILGYSKAVGTSIVLAVVYTLIATGGYLYVGLQQPETNDIPNALGYIYLPAFFLISLTISTFPMVGRVIAKKISVNLLEKYFYLFLLMSGLVIFYTYSV